MSENLDWTRDMGDAFLEQQSQLLDAVQRLRNKAYEQGNVETSAEQTVTVEQNNLIVITPADPEVIYVPTYSPTVVYGTWPYPVNCYEPLYATPYSGNGRVAYRNGAAVGGAMWGRCEWGWGHSGVNIDVNQYNTFNQFTNNGYSRITSNKWQHDPSHRKSVNYRDPKTSQCYGGASARDRSARNDARGFGQAGSAAGVGAGSRVGAGTAQATGRSSSSAARSSQTGGSQPGSRAGAPQGSGSSSSGSVRGSTAGGALQGAQNPSFDRAASSRGSASLGSSGGSRGGSSRSGRGRGGR